jgi:ABC-type transport system substrate-binding protein/DNA-binding SARP family transcriptional activator
MEIRVLGVLDAHSEDGHVIALGGTKQRATLAMLALHVNEPVSSDRLIEALWGEEAPASAQKMVQLYVSQLRKLLGDGDGQIVTRGRGYELRLGAEQVDAVRFERLVEAGDADEALALWRGHPLDDLADEPFAAAEIRRLEELWLRAREIAIDQALAAGRHQEVVGELDELVAAHPLRERLHAQRMLALYRCSRQAEALEAYRTAREVLVNEIGVEPGRELRELHEAILQQDPALDLERSAEPVRAAAAPTPGAASHTRRRLVALAVLALAAAAAVFGITRLSSSSSLGHIDENAVGLIDPGSGDITKQYTVGHDPSAIASGGGSVWLANARDGTVTRIEHGKGQVTTIDVGGEPTSLAFGRGSLWVTDGEGHFVEQVDPATNRVRNRFAVGNAPRGVAVTPDAVWVASPIEDRVDRIDLATGSTRTIPIAGRPDAIAAGAGGVWVATEEAGTVARIDPESGSVLGTVAVGNAPSALTIGDGSVWVANRADGTLSRIDPANDSVRDTVRVGGSVVAVAAADGGIWVADGSDGVVARVDARTGQVTRRVPVRGSPAALVAADGSLWTATLAARTSHRGGTLTFASGPFGFCGCVDPAGYDGRNYPLLSLAYDGLTAYRRVGGAAGSALVGNLATKVPQPVDGGRTYVFQLRPGLRFSNGAPVRPEDFRASLERLFRVAPPTVPGPRAIVGAAACNPRACDLSKGVVTDDRARTITIHLAGPDPLFPDKLAVPLAYLLPAGSPPKLAVAHPLPGTGPYRVVSFDPAHGALLERNPYFRSWSDDARPGGFPDRIRVTIGGDAKAQVAAVAAGRADVFPVAGTNGSDLPAAAVRGLGLADVSRLHTTTAAGTTFLFLNTREPPFDDVRVRRALNFAVDRRRAVDLAGGPTAAGLSCQIIPPGLPGYVPSCPYTLSPSPGGGWTGPDLARARTLIAASGTRGQEVDVWSFGPYASTAAYASRLLQSLGYRSRPRVIGDVGKYFSYVADSQNHVQIGFTGWSVDELSPADFFGPNFSCAALVPHSPNNTNYSQYCDPSFDAALGRAANAHGAAANALWAALDRRLARDAPAVPLYNPRSLLLVSDRVGNVEQQLQLGPLLDQFWVR